ncbi:hypothetical protein Lser_V15G15892 [Lactuca serriola]
MPQDYRAHCPVFFDVEPSKSTNKPVQLVKPLASLTRKRRLGNGVREMEAGFDRSSQQCRWVNAVEFIENIVKEIWLNLHSINGNINSKSIDMGPQIDEILSFSGRRDGDVCMIGITGREGIGKTTLATAICDRESSHFEGTSFVTNVREISEPSLSGLMSLQKKILSDVLIDEDIIISSVSEGKNTIKEKLGHQKVLVVLDDVDRIEQLQALAGAPNWFGKGSMIIISARDEKLLLQHGVEHIHLVPALPEEEAIHLFSWFAFRGDNPVKGYKQLSLEVVDCAAGLPLAIKLLGSFLRDKNESEWRDVLKYLKVISFDKILECFELCQNILESSYNSLDDDNKDIFLDVACFMKGLLETDAIRILESCRLSVTDGLRVLERKSLLTVSHDHRLGMDTYIECMGRNIVRRLHPYQPNQHSRLWIRKEIEDVLANDLGTEATGCILLSELQLSHHIIMEGVGRMDELRCLIVESENENDDLSGDWEFDEVRQYLPNALRFLRWVCYPFLSLPVTFHASNLVSLELPGSRITQLWEDGEIRVLNNLRFLDLSRSMLTTLNLQLTPRLEWLELKECHDLVVLLTPVGSPTRLFHLDLIGCSSFDAFSYIKRLESLKLLSLSNLHLTAKSLQKFSRRTNIPRLEFTCSYTEEVPSSSRDGLKFVSLNLQPRTKLESVSRSICGLQHLRHLTLEGCIPEVPNDLGQLQYLEKLNLLSTLIKCLPDSICMLKHLKSLKVKSCLLLEELPKDLGQLECLEKLSLLSTGIRRLPDSICILKRLRSLKVKSCLLLEEVPKDIGQLVCLEKLNFLSASIKCLPDSICMLECLKSLKLELCGSLERLPNDLGKLNCLERLILTECTSLKYIPNSICKISNLKWFHLPFCDQVKELPIQLGHLRCLSELNIKGTGISRLPLSISLVEDLRIIGSVAVLQTCEFISEIQTSEGEFFCYIQP